MTNLLFQAPWWLSTGFILLGLGVFWTSNTRRKRNGMFGGLAVMLVGIAIAVVSYCVETEQEKAVSRVNHLVAAVNQRDWPGFRRLVDPQTNIYGFHGSDQITQVIQQAAERYDLGSSTITGTDVQQLPTRIDITIRILTQGEIYNGPSDWQFTFQDLGRGFELREIQALASKNQDPSRISEVLKRF